MAAVSAPASVGVSENDDKTVVTDSALTLAIAAAGVVANDV